MHTCPMHPEIRQHGPGSCPICGMALEPAGISLDDGPNPERIDFTRRMTIAVILTFPLFLLAMGEMFPFWPEGGLVSPKGDQIAQLILATPVLLWCGWPFFVRGYEAVARGTPNMFTLIALGTGVAYVYSTLAVLAPDLFADPFRDPETGRLDLYFEAAAVIVTLVLVGQVLELRARERTSDALRALLGLAPPTARRIGEDGGEADVPLAEVEPGDRLRILAGLKVPVDGVVESGAASIDESMITGEPLPVAKAAGDPVTGATLAVSGSLIMRAERVGQETLLARIVAMVADAQRSRAPVQQLVDQVSAWFVPLVVAIAVLAFLSWSFWGPAPALAFGVITAVSVLIIACPCALGLATPMSIMVGMGRGARAGVLFRDADALQQMESVDTLVLDKTGTLTRGMPEVVALDSVGDWTQEAWLPLAAAAEQGSAHPLAGAVLRAAGDTPLETVSDIETLTGRGLVCRVGGRVLRLGNPALMQEAGIDVSALDPFAEARRDRGETVVFCAIDEKLAGALAIADPIKDTSLEAIRGLQAEGLRILMLTGDEARTAERVAAQLGISEVRAGIGPEEKGRIVAELQAEGCRVAMAGDGINDAPALALAQVGIAMGTGADVAIEAAGITLVKGDVRGILRARRLSVATMRNIRQNLVFAFGYNGMGIPVAAGVLFPFVGVLLSPMLAGAAMSLSSVSVIANALRLNRTAL